MFKYPKISLETAPVPHAATHAPFTLPSTVFPAGLSETRCARVGTSRVYLQYDSDCSRLRGFVHRESTPFRGLGGVYGIGVDLSSDLVNRWIPANTPQDWKRRNMTGGQHRRIVSPQQDVISSASSGSRAFSGDVVPLSYFSMLVV